MTARNDLAAATTRVERFLAGWDHTHQNDCVYSISGNADRGHLTLRASDLHLLIEASRPRVVTTATTGFLCVGRDEYRVAEIVQTRDEVIDWLGREWFGQDPRNPDDQWIVDEVMAPIDEWGDGGGELRWEPEGCEVSVTALGAYPYEWADAGSPPVESGETQGGAS